MVDFSQTKAGMQKASERFRAEIAAIRTGRATPSLIEDIVCPAYGGTQRLRVKELASISVSDSQLLLVQPWDPAIIGEIRKGILEANVGLNPVLDNTVLRVPIPPLTAERRAEYVKLLRQKLEEARVAIRTVRQDQLKEIRRSFENKEISEDEKFRLEQELQRVTDKQIAQVEEMGAAKRAAILTI